MPTLRTSFTLNLVACALFMAAGCSKKTDPSPADQGLATIQTGAITDIGYTTAKATATLVNEGSSIATGGIVYAKTAEPTLYNSTVPSGGTGPGTFTVSLTGLEPGTLYHLRAYATNAKGTVYGEDKTFTTLSAYAPGVRILEDSATATSNTIRLVSYVDSIGSGSSTGSAFVLSPNPDFRDSIVSDAGIGIGKMTALFTNLLPGTTYYAKFRATNSYLTSASRTIILSTTSPAGHIETGSIVQDYPISFEDDGPGFYAVTNVGPSSLGDSAYVGSLLPTKPTTVGTISYSPAPGISSPKCAISIGRYISRNIGPPQDAHYFGISGEPLTITRVGTKLRINFTNLSEVDAYGNRLGTAKISGYVTLP